MSDLANDSRITPLNEDNYASWFVNIRARLRSKKLWKYTQSPYITTSGKEGEGKGPVTRSGSKEQVDQDGESQDKWEEKAQEAADILTPLVSPSQQQKLTEVEFNDGYLMLTRLQTLCQPQGTAEFMRLSKEYYTISYKDFENMSLFITHIKVLEEKIDATKLTLDTDNRTILCLSMALPQRYQYLVQIWAVTPNITAEKARTMLLEVSRQELNKINAQAYMAKGGKSGRCKHCGGNHPSDGCWPEHPEKAPEWWRMMQEYKKNGGNKAMRVIWGDEDGLPSRPFMNM